MAEPLKNSFGPEVPEVIAQMVGDVYPEFDDELFLQQALDGYADLELTPRARHISEALADTLPENRKTAMEIITTSLRPETPDNELSGMEAFRYLPFVFFVADHGIDHFDTAMTTQYELTKRFTAEFSIRAYLTRYQERTLGVLRTWASDDNVHVRRLVSEGTRPRLPWAPRLRQFQQDPTPVLELLELLKNDPEEYVRRSVANNLNDIAKDHPEVVVDTAKRWWSEDKNTRRLVRHALRTLIKDGDPGALAVLGYDTDSPVRVTRMRIDPQELSIGESTRVTVELSNPSEANAGALVDFVVHFVKQNGSTSPKVFKGGERRVGSGETMEVSKLLSLKQRSTRTHYPGTHKVDTQLNGQVVASTSFVVVAAD